MEKTPIKFIWHYVKIFKLYFVCLTGAILFAQICGQTYPYYLAKIYNTVAGEIGSPDYWMNIINMGLIALLLGAAKVLFTDSTMFMSAKFFPQARTLVIRDTFDYVNKHSIAYFNNEMSGNIANKVTQLNSGVLEFFGHFMNAMYSVFFLFVGFVILSVISVYFFIALALWLVIIFSVGRKLGEKRYLLSKETSHQQSLANGMIVDSLSNYSEIKSFANFKFERYNLLKYLKMLRKAENKEQISRSWIHLYLSLATILSTLTFMLLSIWALKINNINTTEFIFVNTLFGMMSGFIFDITWVHNNLSRVYGQLSSALDTLAVEPEINNAPNAKELKTKAANIVFEAVDFCYPGKDNLFNQLSIEIKEGEKVGLVGLSGSGKSSFVKLISRYFDVSKGCIKINGMDIRNISQDSLHKNIAAIPQDVCLFNRTLFENIRYGRTNASEAEVIKAAKKASADVFIREFSNGYQTKVGERGVVLSGGERQRIAIARAILKNAPILILDEATSALDSKSELHIQKSLANLMKNKTVIAIAHRLSTLREMDRILVFDHGRIVEEGSHLSLLRKKGHYYKFYNMQAGGFVGSSNLAGVASTSL